MKIIKFVVGDWSRDGHGMSESFEFETNLTTKEVEEAYSAGTKLLSFNFEQEVANDYDDRELTKEQIQELSGLGLDLSEIGWEQDDGNRGLNPEDFVEIYLFITNLGNKNATFEPVKSDVFPIGGYGLFSR